jgi:hypothetical protein
MGCFERARLQPRRKTQPEYHGGNNVRIAMVSHSLAVASVLLLLTSCLGQDRGGGDPMVAVPLIKTVLITAQVSGTLGYWGRCDSHGRYPDFPQFRAPQTMGATPVHALREMFVDDPKMRVTREPGGNIRMFETDVPMDLLDVKISHISFKVTGPKEIVDVFNSPNMALRIILHAPEVRTFMKAQNIGPLSDVEDINEISGPNSPHVSGELDNVTVSQALDYVLRTFPGFWIYENCTTEDGSRTVFFNFF